MINSQNMAKPDRGTGSGDVVVAQLEASLLSAVVFFFSGLSAWPPRKMIEVDSRPDRAMPPLAPHVRHDGGGGARLRLSGEAAEGSKNNKRIKKKKKKKKKNSGNYGSGAGYGGSGGGAKYGGSCGGGYGTVAAGEVMVAAATEEERT
ncbi:hypothetical protein RHMOL_Rhmol05G0031100 [Rhododendron molle]|uniref:Uncharacterized protein n=1 Tax=Rhododendron molle TaxID=49168 RepID=A0ACC0NK41_RHOML|nr:hypothetical protein RHMOL_Rhmol05G0031100 [Rhododendron molle]